MSQNFKILFDYSIFFHQPLGGISRYVINLNNKLIENNIDSRILSPIHKNRFLKELVSCKINKFVDNFPKNTLTLSRGYNNILTSIYLQIFKPNIIHKTYYGEKYFVNKKAKKVLNVYDLIHEKFYQDYNQSKNSLPKKKSLINADIIICPSINTKKDLIEIYRVKEDKIKVINIGISDFKNISYQNEDKLDYPYLLYVGYRGKYKNFKNLVIAIGKSKRILNDFKIVCFGGGKFSNEEKNLIRNNNLNFDNFIQIEGNDLKLTNLYKNARAFLFPSIYEGQGLPQLEAMSFGCPVISSNQEAILEAIGDSAVLFDPLNIEDIKFKIENTIYSDDKIEFLKKKSLKRSKLFTMDRCFEETLKTYKEII